MSKSVISGFINNSDLENKIKILETKAEIKSEQDKILKMVTYDLSCIAKCWFEQNKVVQYKIWIF